MKNILIFILFFICHNSSSSQDFREKIFPNDPNTGVFFGRFLSANENDALISSYLDFENGQNSGSVYVYRKSDNYEQLSKIYPSDGGTDEYFGYSLASFGDWAIIGSHHDNDKGASSGSVYLLKKHNDSWNLDSKIVPIDLSEADEFGNTVDIDSRFLASCAYLDDDKGTNSGSVYIYEKSGNDWLFNQKIFASDPEPYSEFGFSLEVEDDLLLVGSPLKDEEVQNEGAVYLFVKEENEWKFHQKLTSGKSDSNDQFGYSIKMHGNQVFIASKNNPSIGQNSGEIYIYTMSLDYHLVLTQILHANDEKEGDQFGNSIEVSDKLLFVGANFKDDNGVNSGSVYVFYKNENHWEFLTKLIPSDNEEFDAFGSSISASDENLLIGAYGCSDNGLLSGAVYYYDISDLPQYNSSQLFDKNTSVLVSNVTNDFINIDKEFQVEKVEVFNLQGNLILCQFINEIDITQLHSGFYILRVTTKKSIYCEKLIKL